MKTTIANPLYRKGIVIAVSTLLLGACGPAPEKSTSTASTQSAKAAAPAESVRLVDVVTAVPLQQADRIEVNGVLAFREETRAAFKTGGVIRRVAVREGDVVKAGDLLAALSVEEIDAGVAQAQALYDKAVRDLKRGESLRAKEVIPQETLDNLRTAEQAARAGLQAARFNRGTAELRAAEDSVVIKRVSEPGEVAGPGQPVLLLGSLKSGLVFRGGLTDAQRVRLSSGSAAEVRMDAWPGEVFEAAVSELGQAADARTGAYRVELKVQAAAGKTLLAGMVGRARLSAKMPDNPAWVLPLSAVADTSDNQVSVYRVQAGDTVQRQQLPLQQLRRDSVVVGGIDSPDARYVSSGVSYLTDGAAVRINASSNAAAGGTAP